MEKIPGRSCYKRKGKREQHSHEKKLATKIKSLHPTVLPKLWQTIADDLSKKYKCAITQHDIATSISNAVTAQTDAMGHAWLRVPGAIVNGLISSFLWIDDALSLCATCKGASIDLKTFEVGGMSLEDPIPSFDLTRIRHAHYFRAEWSGSLKRFRSHIGNPTTVSLISTGMYAIHEACALLVRGKGNHLRVFVSRADVLNIKPSILDRIMTELRDPETIHLELGLPFVEKTASFVPLFGDTRFITPLKKLTLKFKSDLDEPSDEFVHALPAAETLRLHMYTPKARIRIVRKNGEIGRHVRAAHGESL